MVGWMLGFYSLATSMVISGWVLSYENVHSWQLYRGNQADSIMIRYPTQSHYLNTELDSPCPILIMLSARIGSNKHEFCKTLDGTELPVPPPHGRPALYQLSHRARSWSGKVLSWLWWALDLFCFLFCAYLSFLYILATSGWGVDLWQCALMVTLYHWHHDLISHTVTLSWYCANQSMSSYPINAECQAR